MTQIITATYENGVFKPDSKLDLAAGAKVQLVVTPCNESKRVDDESVGEADRHCDDQPTSAKLPRMTREELNYRPTIYAERERLREEARQRIQREWDATFEQRQKALDEWERLCREHPIDTRGERMTRDQLHERR